MKQKNGICAFVTFIVLFSLQTQATSVTFDPSKPGSVINTKTLTGTCLPIWNNAQLYDEIKKGLSTSNYRLFRFPNGSLSNGYHWNSNGAYNNDGVWECDSLVCKPGFVSMTKYRGTSVSNYGFSGASKLLDGDTSTYWCSDPAMTESKPYFYLEFPKAEAIDSVVIVWGDNYGVDFSIDFYASLGPFYPGPYKYQDDNWRPVKHVTANDQTVFTSAVSYDNATVYLRVITNKCLDTTKGVQVKELYVYSKGKQISVNSKQYAVGVSTSQTKVTALPTHPASENRPDAANWKTWHFESFMDYIKSMSDSSVPVITINFGTGTPQEAASWVYYANIVKKYGVKYWQIGNEMDGEWEDGGPINALMYAEKYVQIAKAMKKVDPTIKIMGPVLSNAEFNMKNSGIYDGKSWLESFLYYVGKKEKADSMKYCDGIDFHTYPYWASNPTASTMLQKIDFVYKLTDSLTSWNTTYLEKPESTLVMMSEYNSTVVLSSMLQKAINGMFVANMFAGHAEKFGSQAMSVFWDSYESGDVGSNGSFGSLSLFNLLPGTQYSSFSKAPSSAFWALYAATNLWINPDKQNTVVKPTYNKTESIRAYGMKTDTDFKALFFNASADTQTVVCTLSTSNYTHADVYTWGEDQFLWNGTDKKAYAFPNCGPVSYRTTTANLKEIVVPASGLCLVRYYTNDSTNASPRFIHVGSKNVGLSFGQYLAVCGTVSGNGTIISKVDYAFDSQKEFTGILKSLDSLYDGPFESFADSISTTALSSGKHMLYIRAQNAASQFSIDSIPFVLTGALRPVVMINDFEDSALVSMLPNHASWRMYAAGKNESFIKSTFLKDSPTGTYLNQDFNIVEPVVNPGYENYVSFSVLFDSTYMQENSDKLKGITLTYKTTHSGARNSFTIFMLSKNVKDYDDFLVPLANTGNSWKTVTLSWNDFHQVGWGTSVGTLLTKDIRGLEFRANSAGTGIFAVDNIAFLSDSGEAIFSAVKYPQAKATELTGGYIVRHTVNHIGFVLTGKTNPLLKAQVYAMNGKFIRNLSPSEFNGKTYFSWAGENTHGRVAQGVYVFMIKSGKTILCNKPVIISK